MGGTLSIESSDSSEATMLRASSTYGVNWKGGYGRVSGPVVSQDRDAVVRRFDVATGSPPQTGTKASIDLVAFPDDPRFALGPKVEEVTYTSPLGRFPAYFVPRTGGDQKTWAVLVHGKGGSRTELYRMARATVAAGLPAGAHVPPTLTWPAERIAAERFDVDWDALDYLADGSPWLDVATLVFHGTADTTVPISTSRELEQANPEVVALVETKGVEHVRSWNADPEAYDRAVKELVDRL